MIVTIQRLEQTIIPQTMWGRRYADLYTEMLDNSGVIYERKEDTVSITINIYYSRDVGVEESEDKG